MKNLIILLVAATAVAACNKDNNQSAGQNTEQTVRDATIQGKYFWGQCTTEPSVAIATGLVTGEALKASRTGFYFDGAQATRLTSFYEAADCAGQSAFTFRELAAMNIQTDKKSADDATFIDFRYDRLMVHIDSPTGLTVANGINLCQARNWAANEDRDVTASSEAITCYTQKLPRTELNIYRLEGDKLFLGSETQRDANDRPAALDRARQQYVKQ